jgi:hypothetical protein
MDTSSTSTGRLARTAYWPTPRRLAHAAVVGEERLGAVGGQALT